MKMKKGMKKAIIAGAVFTAALNMNACAYGSPPDHYTRDMSGKTVAVFDAEKQEATEINATFDVEVFDDSLEENDL